MPLSLHGSPQRIPSRGKEKCDNCKRVFEEWAERDGKKICPYCEEPKCKK